MGKVIIDNQSNKITDSEAITLVASVISEGRISNSGKNYCYLSLFSNRDSGGQQAVSSRTNKNSDKFTIWDYGKNIN
mgnify:CR=1 FL=1